MFVHQTYILVHHLNSCNLDEERIAILTLNNPAKLNALTEQMGDELTDQVNSLRDNVNLRAAVLTGAGNEEPQKRPSLAPEFGMKRNMFTINTINS